MVRSGCSHLDGLLACPCCEGSRCCRLICLACRGHGGARWHLAASSPDVAKLRRQREAEMRIRATEFMCMTKWPACRLARLRPGQTYQLPPYTALGCLASGPVRSTRSSLTEASARLGATIHEDVSGTSVTQSRPPHQLCQHHDALCAHLGSSAAATSSENGDESAFSAHGRGRIAIGRRGSRLVCSTLSINASPTRAYVKDSVACAHVLGMYRALFAPSFRPPSRQMNRRHGLDCSHRPSPCVEARVRRLSHRKCLPGSLPAPAALCNVVGARSSRLGVRPPSEGMAVLPGQ